MDDQILRTPGPLRTTCIALLLAASVGACNKEAPAPVAPPHQPEGAATASTMPVAAASAVHDSAPGGAEGAIAIPADVDAIWAEIDKQQAELAAVVATGDLAQTHHHAFAIRDLLAAVPAHAATLSVQDRAALERNIAFVATLAGRLDSAGDAGDRAEARAGYAQLAKLLTDTPRSK